MSNASELLVRLEDMASNFIVDRTEQDRLKMVELRHKIWSQRSADENTYLRSVQKGSYNYTDLNRVSEFCNTFAEYSAEIGYPIDGYVDIRTNWVANENILKTDLRAYTKAINKIQNTWALDEFDIPLDISQGLSIAQANAIELMLLHCLDISENIMRSYKYSGEFKAKE